MPSTPVDDHTDEFEQLAGLSALDVLEGDDLARYERHASTCERCQVTERLDREALARIAPEMDPSPDFKARLMRRGAEELAAAPRSENIVQIHRERPPNVIPLWRRSRWASALAAVLALALLTTGVFTYENQVVATYALTGSVPGSAVVVVRRSGAAELELNGLQEPGPGSLYEAWIIRGGQPVAAGTTASGTATLPLPSDVRGTTVAITREVTRVETPTLPVILMTAVS